MTRSPMDIDDLLAEMCTPLPRGTVDIGEDDAKKIIAESMIRLVLHPPGAGKYARTAIGTEIFHDGRWKALGLTTDLDDVGTWKSMSRVEGARKFYLRMAKYGARINAEHFDCIYSPTDG